MKKSRKTPSSEIKEGKYRSIFNAANDGLILIDLETDRVVDANAAAWVMHGYTCEEFIGLHPTDLIHPMSRELFRDFVQTFRSDAEHDTLLRHVCRDGATFYAEWRGRLFSYRDRPCLLGVVRDVSRRIRTEKRLQKRIEANTREQATLLEISHTLASTLELQPGLILDQLREIIEYTHAGLFKLDDSTLTALAVNGPQQLEQAVPFQVRVEGPGILEALFNEHRPIRIADVNSADPEAVLLRLVLKGDTAGFLKGVQAWMWVPLEVKGRIIGVLGIAHSRRNFFTAHHAALALSMADQVAITMVNSELYENARGLAALQERQRLAQNLHDAVNQSLFSAGLIAEVLPRLWDRDQAEARKSLEDLRRLTRGALAEMRGLLAELRPSVISDSSLGDLLRQLANAFTGRTNIPVSVTVAGEHVLSSKIQVALYRICQETLNNIAKHAEASRVEIDLHYDANSADSTGKEKGARPATFTGTPQRVEVDSVEMQIRDDGRGFDSSVITAPGHYGLGMMRERAEAVGAQLTVISHPGQGTEVTLRWPRIAKQEAL